MARRGGLFLTTLTFLALSGVAAGTYPGLPVAQLGPITVPADTLAAVWDPATVQTMPKAIYDRLYSALSNPSYWLSSHPTDPTIDCAEVKRNTLAALAGKGSGGDNWFIGTDTAWYGADGQHFKTWHETIISTRTRQESKTRGTVIHEAQHHAGEMDEGKADDAIGCFTEGNEEDDDDDGGGGGGGGTTWVPGETCTTGIEYEEKWVPCTDNDVVEQPCAPHCGPPLEACLIMILVPVEVKQCNG